MRTRGFGFAGGTGSPCSSSRFTCSTIPHLGNRETGGNRGNREQRAKQGNRGNRDRRTFLRLWETGTRRTFLRLSCSSTGQRFSDVARALAGDEPCQSRHEQESAKPSEILNQSEKCPSVPVFPRFSRFSPGFPVFPGFPPVFPVFPRFSGFPWFSPVFRFSTVAPNR